MSALLDVAGLRAGYGDIEILNGVDLRVDEGEIVALLGANGAGKSTLLGALTGLVEIAGGEATFAGSSLRRRRADDIVALGIAHVPQGRRLFGAMTVLDNLRMGAYRRSDGAIGADLERVFALFPRLRERRAQAAGTLSGGEQQMCAIGRALMSKPRLLLVDELSLGLAPIVVEQLLDVLVSLRSAGSTVIVVEQDVLVALEIADRAYVIETGRVAMSGAARDLAADPHIKTAYLGL